MISELIPGQLRLTYNPDSFRVESTASLKPSDGIIGQHRAVTALRFGLNIHEIGFNIFVAGPRGIGKMTAVRSFIEELAGDKPVPGDWCYVNNFEDAFQPRACRLPPGQGKIFHQDMKRLVEQIQRDVPRLFESDDYSSKRDEITNRFVTERDAIAKTISQKASDSGFLIQATQSGIMLIPAKNGQPLSESEWNAVPPSDQTDRLRMRDRLQEELKEAVKATRLLERKIQSQLSDLDEQIILFSLQPLLEELRERYKDLPDILRFLQDLQNDLVENIDLIKTENPQDPNFNVRKEAFLKRYTVNLLIDHSRQTGAPVVVELNPTYNNLFGRVEKETYMGTLYTDFTMIKPGSMHRANGGFIVLPIEDVIRNFMSWDGLKRALRGRSIRIEELSESMGMTVTKSLRPEAIPLDIKIILVGRPVFYYMLHSHDEEFPELFRVKADFDTSMTRNQNNIHDFISFLSMLCCKEQLKHLDGGAIAKMLEYASRFAEDREKLSTHFGAMADIVREGHFWATQEGAEHITADHILKTLNEKIYRSNLVQERIQELIARNILLVDTDGSACGQVNGLSVLRMGEFMFGKPSRITATCSPGTEGIIDIEKQVALGGPIHSKGVLILQGIFMRLFAKDQKLSFSARVVFEQSYEGVEGDSASSAEMYALLSSLSGLPADQGIAVTGSVNQNGQIQAIGGVNSKIEGFYDVCCVRKLTGKQGVIIPDSNLPNLMLREDVVEAVRNRLFHIWAVSDIGQGIELLTGRPAGKRDRQGKFPARSVYGLVEQRLRDFAEQLKGEKSSRIKQAAAARKNARKRRPVK